MDDIVVRGMAKWPNVPAVYGWLSLDRRGNWLIKGERIANSLVSEFIGRNYACDARGRWFFQNGPQRVFVALDYAPFVFRVASPEGAPLALEAHTGRRVAAVTGAWLDENGTLLLQTDLGAGTIHDRDLERLLPALTDANGTPLPEDVLDELMTLAEQGRAVPLWLRFRDRSIKVEAVQSALAPERFGYVVRPAQPAGQEECY
jgi:hypothetical protein